MSPECPFLNGNDVFQCHPRALPAARDNLGFKPEEITLPGLKKLLCEEGDSKTQRECCPAGLDLNRIGAQSMYARRTTNNHS